MFAVFVTFDVIPERRAAFMSAMRAQARNSVANEVGCIRFDVLIARDNLNIVHLYEVYDNENAFEHHLESDHFLAFREQITPWVNSFEITRMGVDLSIDD